MKADQQIKDYTIQLGHLNTEKYKKVISYLSYKYNYVQMNTKSLSLIDLTGNSPGTDTK